MHHKPFGGARPRWGELSAPRPSSWTKEIRKEEVRGKGDEERKERK